MIYTVTLNPALDRAYSLKVLKPGAVNKVNMKRQDPGGNGLNVSKVLAVIGHKNTACATLGGETGRQIASLIENVGIDSIFVYQEGDSRINLKITDHSGITTDINATGPKYEEDKVDELKEKIMSVIKDGDILVLGGSLPAGAPDDLYAQWTVEFKSMGVKVFLDASGSALETGLTARPYFVKPTCDELEIDYDFDIAIEKAKEIVKSGINKVIISLRAMGSVYVDSDGVVLKSEAIPLPPVCATGAGDAMMAAMVYAEETGMDLVSAMEYASAVATSEVLTEGTAAPDINVINNLISQAKVTKL